MVNNFLPKFYSKCAAQDEASLLTKYILVMTEEEFIVIGKIMKMASLFLRRYFIINVYNIMRSNAKDVRTWKNEFNKSA